MDDKTAKRSQGSGEIEGVHTKHQDTCTRQSGKGKGDLDAERCHPLCLLPFLCFLKLLMQPSNRLGSLVQLVLELDDLPDQQFFLAVQPLCLRCIQPKQSQGYSCNTTDADWEPFNAPSRYQMTAGEERGQQADLLLVAMKDALKLLQVLLCSCLRLQAQGPRCGQHGGESALPQMPQYCLLLPRLCPVSPSPASPVNCPSSPNHLSIFFFTFTTSIITKSNKAPQQLATP